MPNLLHEKLTHDILGAAFEVHSQLGPGLLESVYESCLAYEIINRGMTVERQVEVPVVYKGRQLDCGFRMDLVVNKQVVIEVKAIDKLAPIHEAQLHTYLKLSGNRVGLLINFNVISLKDGYKRWIL